jgi:hypothetical protein
LGIQSPLGEGGEILRIQFSETYLNNGAAYLSTMKMKAIIVSMGTGVSEAEQSPPSSAEVKNARSYISTPQYVFMASCLIKQEKILHCVVLI